MDKKFWENKKVYITGITGFKGTWLAIWLHSLGAKVTGFSLNPPTKPSLYDLVKLQTIVKTYIGDIRDLNYLQETLDKTDPDIVFHLAAQPLVRESYRNPLETYSTNVMGTVNILEAVRKCPSVKVLLNVTTDKCYENKEPTIWGYRENDSLGGFDPYSSSKACSEIITLAYSHSYFNNTNNTLIATARAGNVIGGGDWATDRLIPDIVKAINKGDNFNIRNPHAIRPWQHVLDSINGYLLLTQRLFEDGAEFSGAWNFGPELDNCKNVEWIVEKLLDDWGTSITYNVEAAESKLYETNFLKLDSTKSRYKIGWKTKWDISKTIEKTVEWYKYYSENPDSNMIEICNKQISDHMLLGD